MQPPVNAQISSPFGPRRNRFHSGVDYAVPEGTPVSASASGTVVRASYHPDYGNVIVIDHGAIGQNGEHVYTLYAHLREMDVKIGDTVSEGQSIGLSGGALNDPRRGRSTGPHLHYEVIQSITPIPWQPTGPMGVRGNEYRIDPFVIFRQSYTASTALPPPAPRGDPLILDLDGDGTETIAVADGAYFDHDSNGFAERTGWAGSDDGLLVWDRNGDGIINNGRELFGDQTLLKNGSRAANGFQALAEWDDNLDGRIDINDAVWSNLRVWQDYDGDGNSNKWEIGS